MVPRVFGGTIGAGPAHSKQRRAGRHGQQAKPERRGSSYKSGVEGSAGHALHILPSDSREMLRGRSNCCN